MCTLGKFLLFQISTRLLSHRCYMYYNCLLIVCFLIRIYERL